MMGQLPGGQQRLFYSFNLEDHVPAQHLLRSIDQCLDPMVRVLEASNKTKGSVERLGLSFYLLFVGERSPE